MYTNQRLRIKWHNIKTEYFAATNWVKQGGVLSPLLFCIYIDVLLERLRNSCHGCYVGPYFMGAFGYADDLCSWHLA
jgi:hypothetical protein